MPSDFRAKQIQVTQIIASGGVNSPGGGVGPTGIAIYSASDISDNAGTISNAYMFTNVGNDVFLFISGSQTPSGKNRWKAHRPSVTLFGGDIVVSGTLYAEKSVIEVETSTTGSLSVSGSLTVADGMTINIQGNDNDTMIKGAGIDPLIYVDASADRVGMGTSEPMNRLQIAHSGGDGDDGLLITRWDSSTADGDLLGGIGFDSTDGNVPSSITEASAFIAAYAAEAHGTSDKGGDLVFGTSVINDNDDTTSTEHMRILDSGRIGIGTDAPGAKVEIDVANGEDVGGLLIDFDEVDAAVNALKVDSENTTYPSVAIKGWECVRIEQDISNGYGLQVDRSISESGSKPLVYFLDAHTSNTQTTLKVRQDGTGDILNLFDATTEVFTVIDGGKVGIVSLSPAAELEVGDAQGNQTILLDAHDNFSASIAFRKSTGTTAAALTLNKNEDLVLINSGSNKNIEFTINDGGTLQEMVRISGGLSRVGVGTTSPDSVLHISDPDDSGHVVVTIENEDDNNDWDTALTWKKGGNAKYTLGVDDSDADRFKLVVSGLLGASNMEIAHFAAETTAAGGEIVFNEQGRDYDFRVETSNVSTALVVDGGTDVVSVYGPAAMGDPGPGGDTVFFVSGTIDGKNGASRAVSEFTGDVVVSGSIHAASKIIHEGDTDTFINFTNDDIDIQVGGRDMIRLKEDNLQDEVVINEGGVDVDFRVESANCSGSLIVDAGSNRLYVNKDNAAFTTIIENTNAEAINVTGAGVIFNEEGHVDNNFRVESLAKSHALFVDAGESVVRILSEGAVIDSNTGVGGDVNFFVSGTVGTKNSSTAAGSALFGGDLIASGVLYIDGGTATALGEQSGQPASLVLANGIAWDDGDSWIYESANNLYLKGKSDVFVSGSDDVWLRASDDIFISAGDGIFFSGGALTSFSSPGADTVFQVSGSIGSIGTSEKGASVFLGDLLTSGALHIKGGATGYGQDPVKMGLVLSEGIVWDDSDAWIYEDSNNLYAKASGHVLVKAEDGDAYLSGSDDAIILAGDDILMQSVDTVRIWPQFGAVWGTPDWPSIGTDVNFQVSGSIGSQGNTGAQGSGVAEFLGDVVVSGALNATYRIGLGKTSPGASIDMGSTTDAIVVSVGTTGQRPASPALGMIRYNTSGGKFEGYTATGGGSWGNLSPAGDDNSSLDTSYDTNNQGESQAGGGAVIIVDQQPLQMRSEGATEIALAVTGAVVFGSSSLAYSNHLPPLPGTDTSFFVSGTIGGQGTRRRGVSAFGGDVVITGTLYGGSATLAGPSGSVLDIGGEGLHIRRKSRKPLSTDYSSTGNAGMLYTRGGDIFFQEEVDGANNRLNNQTGMGFEGPGILGVFSSATGQNYTLSSGQHLVAMDALEITSGNTVELEAGSFAVVNPI